MKVLGITGNSGAGKSTCCQILNRHGGEIISADKIGHLALKKGTEVYENLICKYDILDSNNEINRKKLGKIVFNNKKDLEYLNSLSHKFIYNEIKRIIKNTNVNFFVIDAALLYEIGLDCFCDEIWLIEAKREEKLRRISQRDNIDKEAAEKRLNSQRNFTNIWTIHCTIRNNGNLQNFEEEIEKSLKKFLFK
ncbi:MAG: dephospho-CoA kinase [Lachnospirales bacterium]